MSVTPEDIGLCGCWQVIAVERHSQDLTAPDAPASLEIGCYATSLTVDQRDDAGMLAAIRDKKDDVLKSRSVDRIKGWRDALPEFAFEMRERFQQMTGKAFDMRVTEALVEGDRVEMEGLVGSIDGKVLIRDRGEGPVGDAAGVGRELAERMVAQPATPDYSALSVFVQFHAATTIVGHVGSIGAGR